ncbi:3-hydroxy-9,10-secoandrosta-1,3,5(10)-triene-9,17-dione monooxygenase [Kribbella steppae]|uniref:3-hydroxy-9,10-secoandrosta-1,3,5(10)-triene-9, 17-dione monooxygenase n=1 Tax=Kribbella steppae TaxID=2512223 RepID=A0A4R2HFM7_9ACTN|nr:acyl-CoA dehydrogenase family protein [Kribbella steppae]TCO28051.1 3-hydroxy-9,10-secoandrosta-1,3,5(10)-triene-9,17-dione monooxygenase [Kribbella steppae]
MTASLYACESEPDHPAAEGDLGAGAGKDLSTVDHLLEVAARLRPTLLAAQAEHEALGGYAEAIHKQLLDAGFYRMLQPKRYGGLEFSLEDFLRVGIEISRGDPGVGWSFILGAGHTWHVASFFPEQAQRELFASDLIAPGRTIPRGRAVRTADGYQLAGTWDYCSGSMWSTHAMLVAPTFTADDQALGLRVFIVPRCDYEILDDWGGDRTIGMRASSSNSLRVEAALIPEHLSVVYDFKDHTLGEHGTIGYQLHGNPMYLGRTIAFFNCELVATQVGAAWAAFDVFDQLMAGRPASFPPVIPRTESAEYHRWYGKLLAQIDAAETLLLAAMRQYTELGRRWERTRQEFTPEEDARLRGVILQGAQLANEAVDLAFATAGSSAARLGSPMEKYYRDVAMFKTHIAAKWDVTYGSVSRYHFGQPLTF